MPSTKSHKSYKSAKSTQTNQNDNSDPSLKDIYSRVTAKIIADLEKGELTWRKPWNSAYMEGNIMRPLRWNGISYTGINTILLWATAAEKDYAHPHWMTFNQAIELKGSVRKGEKGAQIVYADSITRQEEDKNGETVTSKIPFLKTYTVFNASQIDGLPEYFYQLPEKGSESPIRRNDTLDQFFAQTKADIHIGTKAYYSQQADHIHIPPIESFENPELYYTTLAHELTHWTKHPNRLGRDFGRKTFGDHGYAREELVAELGSCFLGADLGLEPLPQEHHAAYIQSWLKVLNDDKRFIFSAASHAQKAVDYLHSLQPQNN
jgi:antirestriction protein ArdC